MFIESKPVDLLRHYSRISYKEIHILKRFSSIGEDGQNCLYTLRTGRFRFSKEKRAKSGSEIIFIRKKRKFYKKQQK